MGECWAIDATERPSFDSIVFSLKIDATQDNNCVNVVTSPSDLLQHRAVGRTGDRDTLKPSSQDSWKYATIGHFDMLDNSKRYPETKLVDSGTDAEDSV